MTPVRCTRPSHTSHPDTPAEGTVPAMIDLALLLDRIDAEAELEPPADAAMACG